MRKWLNLPISEHIFNFNPKFCGEDCSMESMLDAQMAKFADFRTYLGKLLAERPVQEPLEAPMIDVASGTQAPKMVATERQTSYACRSMFDHHSGVVICLRISPRAARAWNMYA